MNDVISLTLSDLQTLFLALGLFLIGRFLVKKIALLERFCIPAAVIGGLLFAIAQAGLHYYSAFNIALTTSFQSLFMLAFFTTVGLGASFSLIKLGGKLLVIYWLLCGALAVFQNIIGVSMAKVVGLDPLMGVMLGAVSMEGGHGAATAFGATIEALGVNSAQSIGLAAATFGLIAGGLLGGPMAKHLIDKHQLKSNETTDTNLHTPENNALIPLPSSNAFIIHGFYILLCMVLGSWIGSVFSQQTGFVLPGYVGAMLLAVILRNGLDVFKINVLDTHILELAGHVSLAIFLTMALMSIRFADIFSLMVPALFVLLSQVIFMVLFAKYVVFVLLGKSFDAAIMVAGFTGHGLGATPNAIANMNAVTNKYGSSQKAFLIVPLVGAFLIDAVALPVIISTINIFKP